MLVSKEKSHFILLSLIKIKLDRINVPKHVSHIQTISVSAVILGAIVHDRSDKAARRVIDVVIVSEMVRIVLLFGYMQRKTSITVMDCVMS